jgi:hypothetical protein
MADTISPRESVRWATVGVTPTSDISQSTGSNCDRSIDIAPARSAAAHIERHRDPFTLLKNGSS